MKRITTILIFSCLFLLMMSCSPIKELREGDVEVSITTSVGTNFEYRSGTKTVTFLPYITNEGSGMVNGKVQNIAVVGKRIKSGADIHVTPFATLKYTHDQKEHEIILAIPADKKYRSIEIDSYDAFITEYFASKQIIEYWYANRYGLGGVSNVRWNAL